MKTVSVSHRKIRSDVPYPEQLVQSCMQETLDFFYFILTNREDADFTLKGLGTLAIRGTAATMAFSEDFLLTLNKSTYVVEKLLTQRWVTSDREVAFAPSRFGRVHQFPQFEIRAVPRGAARTDEFRVFESLLGSMGLGVAVQRVLQLLRKGRSPERPARAGAQEETHEETERKGSSGRLLRLRASRDGGRHGESLSGSPEFPWPAPEQGHTGQKRQSVFGLNSRRKLEASTARWREKEENRRAGAVTSPQQRAGRGGGGTRVRSMNRTLFSGGQHRVGKLPQEEEDESGSDEAQYLQMAWTEARRKFRAELESLGDVKKWLSNKPSLSAQEIRYLRRIKANRRAALEAAATGSLDDADSPREHEKSRVARCGDGPIDEHCLPSTVATDLGELLDRYRRKALESYLGSSARCRERDVRITEPTLQRGLLHPGDRTMGDGGELRIRQPGGYYGVGGAGGAAAGSSSRAGRESRSQAKKAKKRSLRRNKKQQSSDNNFWPGHLLDKLCLYFPEEQQDRAHPLFSRVHPAKPAHRCVF
nr:EF-hand calcium-binding domain-containing protein 12 isoform X1 [Columba livia]